MNGVRALKCEGTCARNVTTFSMESRKVLAVGSIAMRERFSASSYQMTTNSAINMQTAKGGDVCSAKTFKVSFQPIL
jgi:hypothetical protein